MKAIVPSLAALLVGLSAGGPARGQGDFPLTWSEARETDPIAAVGRFSRKALAQRSVAFKAVPKGLSDKALYFAIPMGSREVLAILDASPPARLYVGAEGTGDLSSVPPLAAREATLAERYGRLSPGQMFGPLSIAVGGTKDPIAKVRFVWGGGDVLGIEPAGYRAGEVRLGGQLYRVVALDANLDGRYDVALQLPAAPSLMFRPAFDLFGMDADQDGEFKFDGVSMIKGELLPLTKMVRVKDAFHTIRVAPDGSSVHLEQVEPPMGTLDVGSADVSLSVISDAGPQSLTGSGGKWQVPTGQYALVESRVTRKDASGAKWTVWHRGKTAGKAKPDTFEIRPGETLTLKLGPPLTPKVTAYAMRPALDQAAVGAMTPEQRAKAREARIFLALVFQGASGEEYIYGVRRDTGTQPPLPTFRILDEAGKVLHAGRFESPVENSYSYWWRAPGDFRGKYRVEVEADLGPLEFRPGEPQWFTLE